MNEKYMNVAINEARIAYDNNEVPVGAVIVHDGTIIDNSYNLKNKTKNIFHHAEMIAIEEASKKIGDWRLIDCEMYVTLEPCPMCASAIQQSRIKKVYIGTTSNVLSNKDIVELIFNSGDSYHKVNFEYIDNTACSKLLTDFFSKKR